MASYIAHGAKRELVTLMFSRAEADALRDMALYAEMDIGEGLPMNPMTRAAANRAVAALAASTNTSARRAGYFDI